MTDHPAADCSFAEREAFEMIIDGKQADVSHALKDALAKKGLVFVERDRYRRAFVPGSVHARWKAWKAEQGDG